MPTDAALTRTAEPVETTSSDAKPRKKVSKSRAPKSQREPYKPAELKLPDPMDYFRSDDYIDQRVAMGDFKGTRAAALPVLRYLWRHTLRNADNPKIGKGEEVGFVLSGKSKLARIAAETNFSYESVQRVVTDLINAEWLAWYGDRDDQTMVLRVRMDMDGHRDRESLRETGVVPEPMADEDRGLGDDRVSAAGPHPVVCETTPPCLGDDTIQGDLQGFDRDSYNEPVGGNPTRGQDQNQRPAGATTTTNPRTQERAKSPAVELSAPSDEELSASFVAYMREHARSPETALRPTEVWDALGIDPFAHFQVVKRLIDEGALQPCERGWYIAPVYAEMEPQIL